MTASRVVSSLRKFGRFSGQQIGLAGTINMENSIEDVKQILERNNYKVVVFSTDGGCIAIFPNRVEPPISGLTRIHYQYNDNGLRIIVSDEAGNIYKDAIYACPIYIQRLLMFSHIVKRCMYINYTIALATFIVGENVVEEDDFYQVCANPKMTTEDLELENQLKPIIDRKSVV